MFILQFTEKVFEAKSTHSQQDHGEENSQQTCLPAEQIGRERRQTGAPAMVIAPILAPDPNPPVGIATVVLSVLWCDRRQTRLHEPQRERSMAGGLLQVQPGEDACGHARQGISVEAEPFEACQSAQDSRRKSANVVAAQLQKFHRGHAEKDGSFQSLDTLEVQIYLVGGGSNRISAVFDIRRLGMPTGRASSQSLEGYNGRNACQFQSELALIPHAGHVRWSVSALQGNIPEYDRRGDISR